MCSVLLDAEKPEEWDDEEDGEWIAPTIRNPKCEEAPGCGEWKRYVYFPLLSNRLFIYNDLFAARTSPTPITRASGMHLLSTTQHTLANGSPARFLTLTSSKI